jgi:hypothetical protein
VRLDARVGFCGFYTCNDRPGVFCNGLSDLGSGVRPIVAVFTAALNRPVISRAIIAKNFECSDV